MKREEASPKLGLPIIYNVDQLMVRSFSNSCAITIQRPCLVSMNKAKKITAIAAQAKEMDEAEKQTKKEAAALDEEADEVEKKAKNAAKGA